jgi:ABC-type dipeptide/oligopeptide/nickel transport system ATPase component
MKDSEIIERGTLEEVLKNPRQPYTRALLDASRLSGDEWAVKEEAVC